MKAFTLPCDSSVTDYVFQCDLDAVTYGFRFRWNERLAAWFMDILDVSANPLVTNLRVTVGYPLASRAQYNTALPPGLLIATDTSGADIDPGLTELGTRVQILYFSDAG